MRTALLYNFLLEANLMASIAIILMMVMRKALRKPLGNSALNFGWLLIAIRLLLPLSLPNPYIYQIRTPYAPDEAIRPIAGQIKVRLTDLFYAIGRGQGNPMREPMNQLTSGMHNAQLPITLAKIYLAGLIVVLIWFIVANIRFRQRMNAGKIEKISGKLEESYLSLCKELKAKPLPVYFIDPLPSACLVGVFKPYIALPLTVSPTNAIHVLRHEVCHYKNRDNLWGILRLMCCAIHWFNPLVWMAAQMSRTDSELRCDDLVAKTLNPEEKQEYASVLVLSASKRMAPGVAVLATGMTQTHKNLKARVKTILESKKPLRWLAVSFALIASMALVGAFATQEARIVPLLSEFASSLGMKAVSNNKEAMEYGKKLLALQDFGLSPQEDLKYEVWTMEEVKDEFMLSGGPEDLDVAYHEVSFDTTGRLLYFNDYQSPYDQARATEEFEMTASEETALAEDLQRFLRTTNPEEAVRAQTWKVVGKGVSGDKRFITYEFYDMTENTENGGMPMASVVVEIGPATRIVKLLVYKSNMGGNG